MKTLATYKWTKEGMLGTMHEVKLEPYYQDTIVVGERSVPSTVAKAVMFMYEVGANKLVVDEYTIVLDK